MIYEMERIYLKYEELDPSLRVREYELSRDSEYDIPYRRADQECVWRPVFPRDLPWIKQYAPSCGEPTGMAEPTYDYCPFCGNRIRVEES